MFMKWRSSTKIKHDSLTGFTIFVVVLCLLNLVINLINHHFYLPDFRVYYMAAHNLMTGGPVYGTEFGSGSGLYKYSPLTLFLFVPYTFFNYTLASFIHFTLLCIAFWYVYIMINKIFDGSLFPGFNKKIGLLLSLSVLCVLIHLVRELYLGNINLILILLCLIALRLILQNRSFSSGIILGIVFLAKPFFFILILPLLYRKKFKTLVSASVTFIAGILVPFLILGHDRSLSLYSGWLRSMIRHKVEFPGVNTIDYFLTQYVYPGLPPQAVYFIILGAGTLLTVFILFNLQREKKRKGRKDITERNFIFEWFVILALIPNMVKTDTEHFLASAPLITFILFYIAKKKRVWLIPVMTLLIFFFGANSTDLFGKELSLRLSDLGLLGLSNLALLALSFFLFPDYLKEPGRTEPEKR